MRKECNDQYELLDVLRHGPQRHFDIEAAHRRLLVRLWMCGHVRLRAGDFWEITSSGIALWTACGEPRGRSRLAARVSASAARAGQCDCIAEPRAPAPKRKWLH